MKPWILLALVNFSLAYRILIVSPTASFSHQRAHIAICKALAAHGHEVTILTTDPFKTSNPNIKQISLKFLYGSVGQTFQTLAVQDLSMKQLLVAWKDKHVNLTEDIFSHEKVQKLLTDNSQKFNAVIVEYLGYPVAHALAEKYNAALIGVTTLEMWPWAHRSMGNPTHPILHPFVFHTYPEHPNIYQRVQMLYNFYDYQKIMDEMFQLAEPFLKRYVPENSLSISQLMYERVDLAIECVSPAEGFVRPLLPNTQQIGFMHIEPPNPLPQDLQDYLDSSDRGVVYVSFGSNVKSINLGHDLMNVLQSALGSLPFDVLWKYENSSMPNKPNNVKTITWSPQLDILEHPKIKLFVTQGGFQSMEETLARGVPVVVIPFFADQEFNACQMEKLGVGRKVFKKDLTKDRLNNIILEVIQNPKFKRRVVEIGNQVRDTPMNATETAVWYIEHAIRNRGSDIFKYKGKSLSSIEFYFLDIFLLLIGVIFTIYVMFVKLYKRSKSNKQKVH